MLYYSLLVVYLIFILFDVKQVFTYVLREKKNMIYLSKNLLVLPIFMIIVSVMVSSMGFSINQVELYSNNTIVIGVLFIFSFLLIGSILTYILVSWTIKFNENDIVFCNYKRTKTSVLYNQISYIDAFRPSSNGIIHIVSNGDIIKINHNFIMGDVGKLTEIVSKYRKKK